MADRESIAALLDEHRDDMETGDYAEVLWSGCICGDEHPYADHSLHLADVILHLIRPGEEGSDV